MEEVG